MAMTYQYPIVIVREGADYWAYIPDLPGVYGRGRTSANARKDLRAALKLYIEDCRADGENIPASHIKSLKIDHIALAA